MLRVCKHCSAELSNRQRNFCSHQCNYDYQKDIAKKKREIQTKYYEDWVEHEEYPNLRIYKNGEIFSRITLKKIIPQETVEGYLRINTYVKSKGAACTTLVHRIVARVFIGESELPVNHIDSDRKNNSFSNLEYVSVSENNLKKIRSDIYKTKITDCMLEIVFSELEKSTPVLSIVKNTGLNINTINRIRDFYATCH